MFQHSNQSPVQALSDTVTLSDLCHACAMSATEIDELIEYGALKATKANDATLIFDAQCVAPLRQASRLCKDYDLEFFMVVIVLEFLQRIASLEQELHHSQRTALAFQIG